MAEKTDEEIIEELGLEHNEEKLEIQDSGAENDSLEPIADNNTSNYEDEINDRTIENEDYEEVPLQKKQSKLFKILIGIIATLSVILTIGMILYMIGFFEEEPKVKKETKIEKKVEVLKEESKVDIEDVDKNKLNKKLQMLTKAQILSKEELEAEEKKVKEQKELEKKKKELEEQKKKEALLKEQKELENKQKEIKEDLIKFQEQVKKEFEEQKRKLFEELDKRKELSSVENKKENTSDEKKANIVESIINNTIEKKAIENQNMKLEPNVQEEDKMFLSFINVAIIDGLLYKSYLDKVETFDKKISLCRDSKNRIEIYFGPYESNTERRKVFDNLLQNNFKEAFLVDFTKEEYSKRCKY